MKLLGKMLHNAMLYNNVKADNRVVTIHNTDHDGYGFVSIYAIQSSDSVEFTISKKDYQTLSMFDQMDIAIKDNKISVKTKNGKITIANLTDIDMLIPNIDDVYDTQIKPNDFLPGRKFVGNDKVKIQSNGCNCEPNGYFISDSHVFYIFVKDTYLKNKINIPKEAFDYIGDMTTCSTDEKIVVFANPERGQMFYTTLINVSMNIPKLEYSEIFKAAFDKAELHETFKLLKPYSKFVEFKYINGQMHLLTSEETNNFDIIVSCDVINGTKLQTYQSIDNLLKIIDLSDVSDVTLSFNKNMCFYQNDDVKAGSLHYRGTDKMEVE